MVLDELSSGMEEEDSSKDDSGSDDSEEDIGGSTGSPEGSPSLPLSSVVMGVPPAPVPISVSA